MLIAVYISQATGCQDGCRNHVTVSGRALNSTHSRSSSRLEVEASDVVVW